MRICIIGPLNSLHVQRFANWFNQNGHEVHIITWESTLSKNIDGDIKIHIIYPDYSPLIKVLPSKSVWGKILTVKKMISDIEPDIVQGHRINNSGIYTAFCGNYPKFLWSWGIDINTTIHKWHLKALIKLSLNNVDGVFVETKEKGQFINKHWTKKVKILEVPLGVDISNFDRSRRLDEEIIDKNTHNHLIISIRNLIHYNEYDLDTYINCIPEVLKKHPNTMFFLIGRDDSNYAPILQKKIIKLGIRDNFKFLGFVKNEEMPDYLTSSTIFVDTFYDKEDLGCYGHGVALLEAMSSGLPTIVAKRKEITNGIGKWYHGLVFKSGQPDNLAKQINNLLSDTEKQNEIGDKNRKSAIEFANFDDNMKTVEKYYLAAIKKR